MIRRLSTVSFCLSGLLLCFLPVASAQESVPDSSGFNMEQLLKDALLFIADFSVSSPTDNEPLWDTEVNKITIPGRAISVNLEGEEGRLEVVFTLYPAEGGRLLLVAKSQTWFEGNYNSALTSLPIEYHDEVYYYPLGRAGDGATENPVEVVVKINVIPYLETLDEASKAALESALDASARFHLSEKGE